MAWRVARSLDTLLGEINAAHPARDRTKDGGIGDAAHASRSSDHNPWVQIDSTGIVTARDFTHDPSSGLDCHNLAGFLARLALTNDPRFKYLIWNRRILNVRVSRHWRPYNGSNPHTEHLHLSVSAQRDHCDATAPWGYKKWSLGDRVLREGRSGPDVLELQAMLRVTADGDFGPLTKAAVISFQRSKRLSPDGEVGPITLAALRAAQASLPTPPSVVTPPVKPPVPKPEIVKPEKTMYLVTDPRGAQPQYLTDLLTKRWVQSPPELRELLAKAGDDLSRIALSTETLDAIPTVGALPPAPAT